MSRAVVTVKSEAVWPEDSEDVSEAVVANWFVREGGRVDAGESLCEIQIEKVSIDVPAPVSGEVAERLVAENGEFSRGDPLARIRTD